MKEYKAEMKSMKTQIHEDQDEYTTYAVHFLENLFLEMESRGKLK